MLRTKTLRTSLLLSILILGAVYAASVNTKPAEALPIGEYQREFTFINSTIWGHITAANQTSQSVERIAQTVFGTAFETGPGIAKWNNTILQLEGQLSGINTYYKIVTYNMFTLDILLRKYDVAVQIAINASVIADSVQSTVETCITGTACGSGGGGFCSVYSQQCLDLVEDVNHFSIQTTSIQNDILALGSLFTKAKLEFLERPILNCTPRLVAVGKTISCHGSNYSANTPTTAIFQDSMGKNTTAQMIAGTDGSMTANSFFDVFFDVSAPTATGSYKLILEQTGSPGINSYFDVFVEVSVSPTILEPTTIIPITVLIAAVATLAVASRRVRRPL